MKKQWDKLKKVPKYLITKRLPVESVNAILGTIIAKTKGKAQAKAIELTGVADALAIIYSSLSDSQLLLAEESLILWEQPANQHSITDTNPRGGGKPRKPGIAKSANLALSLTPEGYEFYRCHPNKSRLVSELIDREAGARSIDTIIGKT